MISYALIPADQISLFQGNNGARNIRTRLSKHFRSIHLNQTFSTASLSIYFPASVSNELLKGFRPDWLLEMASA